MERFCIGWPEMLELILLSIFIGVILTLLAQYLLFRWLTSFPAATDKWKSQSDPFVLPNNLFKIFGDLKELKNKEEACRSLNFIFQFLFQELKDAEHVRRWAEKRLKNEFSELLQSTTGKLLDDIRVRGFNLGRTFPVIRDFHLSNVAINEDNALDEVTMLLDLTYSGRFQLAIDVDMVFGKSAYLSVTVTKLQGTVRLQLTTTPYRHWSFAFTEDPLLEFEVDSHFEGRPIARLASVVTSQIKRQIRKKHTLPNYKMRYKPFFVLPTPKVEPQDVFYNNSKLSVGKLNVVVVGCTRLLQMPADSFIFCSLSIDSMPWSELMNVKRKSWVTCDCELLKTSPQLGFTFEDTFSLNKYEEAVIVTSVTPGSPAARANIQKNDILSSINGTKVASSKQASRIIRQSLEKVIFRIEREKSSVPVEASRSAESSNMIKVPSMDSLNSYSKDSEAKENLPTGSISVDNKGGAASGTKESSVSGSKLFNGSPMLSKKEMESSCSSKLSSAASLQSVNSNASLPFEAKELKNAESSASKESISENSPNHLNKTKQSTNGEPLEEIAQPKVTRSFKSCQSPVFNQRFQFDVKEHHSYLNVCIWCRETEKLDKQSRLIKMEKDNLLGHVSIPLMDIALECLATLQGDFTNSFNITPSQTKIGMGRQQHPAAATHPGFEERLCHGDVLLRFQYSRGDEGDPNGLSSCNLEIFDSFHKEDGGLPFVVVASAATSKTENAPVKLHNFQSAQFQSAVYCKFCSKKIWFKSAFMCTNCKMVCHKKCIEKCQVQTNCSKIVAPKPSNSTGTTDRKRHLSAPDDKKDGSAIETAAPSLEQNSLTRKSSSSSLKDLSTSESQQADTSTTGEKKVKGTPLWVGADENADEKIVTEAKLAGRQLYTELDIELRKLRFDEVIQTTQLEIERESKHHNELRLLVSKQADKKQKTTLLNKLKNSEDKLKSLKVLMLQFCAGLQHCLDEEELLRQRTVQDAEDEAKLIETNPDVLPSALPQQHSLTLHEDITDSLITTNETEPFLRETGCRGGLEVVGDLERKADNGLSVIAAEEGLVFEVKENDDSSYVEAILKYGEDKNKLDQQIGLADADDEISESEQLLDMEGQAILAFEQFLGNSRSLSPNASDQSRSSPEIDGLQTPLDCGYLESVETVNVGTVDLDLEDIGDKKNTVFEGDAACLNQKNKLKVQPVQIDNDHDHDD